METVQAYIRQPPKPTTDINNNSVDNTKIDWKYSEDIESVINAPINDVIFVAENDDEDHKNTRQKILDCCNIDPVFLKYQKLFDVFDTDYPRRRFLIETQPQLKITNGYDYKKNVTILSQYIKEFEPSFKNRHIMPYILSDQKLKNELNKNGIYIRPVKQMLEHNPVRAKHQLHIRNNRKKKPNIYKIFLQRNDLQAFQSELWRIFSRNIELSIRYRDGLNSSLTKNGICRSILVLTDLYNILFQKNSYRSFESYKKLIIIWESTIEKKRKEYPEEFIKWITIEKTYKLKPKIIETYWTTKKPKLKVFKNSKIKWSKT